MNINVSARGLELGTANVEFVREQVGSSLRRFEDRVFHVDAVVKDINGPKGGIDTQVLLRVRLRSGPVMVTEITRADLHAAVIVCARKARRAVRRCIKKTQQRRPWRTRTAGHGRPLNPVTGA
jgi:ribosome-associated translation inhibitor RaiA